MSLIGLQSAITTLIRLPRENRGDLEAQIKNFALNSVELEAVRVLAEDHELNKYGNELAGQRWDKIFGKIIRLFTFVSREWVESIWFERFEPQATHIEGDIVGRDTFTLAFIDFLTSDPTTRQELSDQGLPYIFDLLAYLRAECYVRRYLDDLMPLPHGSLVQHRAFQVVHLTNDIPNLIERALEEEDTGLSKLEPEQRTMTVLMLKDKEQEFRMFEIEPAVAAFLEGEVNPSAVGTLTLSAEFLDHLADLGLCRPATAHH
jgi:hypothetical protein